MEEPFLIARPTFALVDPVGGERGERACSIALDVIRKERDDVERALVLANAAVHAATTKESGMRGAGCAGAALRITGDRAVIAWAGDVEVALLRGGALKVLTREHSLRNEYVRSGALAPDDLRTAELPTNVIVRTLGVAQSIDVDTVTETIAHGDLFVLTSDSLRAAVGQPDFTAILLRAHGDVRQVCEGLLSHATTHDLVGVGSVLAIKIGGSNDDDDVAGNVRNGSDPRWRPRPRRSA